MPYKDMYSELLGMVPKFPLSLSKKLINRAWEDVRNFNLWSFQLYDGPQWISPPIINSGTVSVTRGSATVAADATAAAAITAGIASYSTIPQRQFRVGNGSIYNIIAWATPNLTLDRSYGEATNASAEYRIYQLYYAAPFQDHVTFLSVRDMENFRDLFLDRKRMWVDSQDPQRMYSNWPTHAVFYKVDDVVTSTTYRYPLYELWSAPLSSYTYNLYGIRNGADFSAGSDAVPVQIGEDVIIERAKYYVYQWAEANRDRVAKGSSDYKFLMKEANAEYFRLVRDYRRRDMERVNNWTFERRVGFQGVMAHYNSVAGTANPGGW